MIREEESLREHKSVLMSYLVVYPDLNERKIIRRIAIANQIISMS